MKVDQTVNNAAPATGPIEGICLSFSGDSSNPLLIETDKSIPTLAQIRAECLRIQGNWDHRERAIRILRSEMACRYGICRNY